MTREELKQALEKIMPQYEITLTYQGSISKIDTKNHRVDMNCYSTLVDATTKPKSDATGHSENIGSISEVQQDKVSMAGDQGFGFDFLSKEKIDNAEALMDKYAETTFKNRKRADYNIYEIPRGMKTRYRSIFKLRK